MTEQEIAFFDRIASEWDDAEILSTPAVVARFVDSLGLAPGARVLDLGTGTGVLVPHLSRVAAADGRVVAVDVSQGMLARARHKYGHLDNVFFVCADFESEPVDGVFDCILLYSVYPHLSRPLETLKRLVDDNLAADGSVVVAFPADHHFVNNIHREKKAVSTMLPPADELAQRFVSYGLKARAVSLKNPYVVVIGR